MTKDNDINYEKTERSSRMGKLDSAVDTSQADRDCPRSPKMSKMEKRDITLLNPLMNSNVHPPT